MCVVIWLLQFPRIAPQVPLCRLNQCKQAYPKMEQWSRQSGIKCDGSARISSLLKLLTWNKNPPSFLPVCNFLSVCLMTKPKLLSVVSVEKKSIGWPPLETIIHDHQPNGWMAWIRSEFNKIFSLGEGTKKIVGKMYPEEILPRFDGCKKIEATWISMNGSLGNYTLVN